MAERDWDNVFFATMAMASVVMATIGVALALRSGSSVAGLGNLGPAPPSGLSVDIPKVHYQNGECLVSVRRPNEWHELREFVQPSNPDIIRVVSRIYG